MTCNDCLHWEACRNLIEAMNPDYKGKNIVIHSVCGKFKNKADFVKVKHGEWIPIVKQDDYLEPPYCDTIKCSECGQEADVSFHEAPYCFRCGATMDGRRDV